MTAATRARLARFWAQVLEQPILFEDDDEVIVGADEYAFPGLCFVPVPEGKTVKNRLHIDLNPDDRDAEVERLLALGAARADVGQGRGRDLGDAGRPRGQRVLRIAPPRHADRVGRRGAASDSGPRGPAEWDSQRYGVTGASVRDSDGTG